MTSPLTPPSTITIAPLDDDEDDEDIITDETPGRTNTLDLTALDPAITIKSEPVDKPVTITKLVARTKGLTTVFPQPGKNLTVRPQTSLLRNLMPVTRGIFRFSSPPPVTVTARAALAGVMTTAGGTGQQMILIPTSTSRAGLPIHVQQNQAPFKLIPIQPKKSQAVVAPQAKQTVVVPASQSAPTTMVPSTMRKGIISFSSDNPDDLSVGRRERTFNPKFGVSGMIFNSRTVTAGGRVKYTKDYLCNLCKHMSDSYVGFKQHFSGSHMFSCDYCNYKAFSRYEVVVHTKSNHIQAIDDLKGYEMFEEVDVAVTTVLGSTGSIQVATVQSSGSSSVASSTASASSTSLVTVPVLATNGNKLVIQTGSRTPTTPTTVVSLSGTVSSSVKAADAPIGSYFTYKIVYGSKSEPKKYECDLCQYQTPVLTTMYEHASSHTMADLTKSNTNTTTWECYYCNFKSSHQPDVVQHVTMAHPSKHIQLKRYTSTSVVRNNVLTTATTTTSALGNLASSVPTLRSAIPAGSSLIIRSNAEQPKSILLSSVLKNAQKGQETPASSTVDLCTDDELEKPKEKGDGVREKTAKDVDDEDDGSAMWGCYYCEFEDQDRHNVVAHVKADHAGRKIVITRRRLLAKDGKEASANPEKPGGNAEKPGEGSDSVRKNYESLIIKLRTSNKTDKRVMDNLKNLGRASNASDSEEPDLLPSFENGAKDVLSGGEVNDLEMPILEKMVPGQKSPRSPRGEPLESAKKAKLKSEKKKVTGTRVKSDLAFDQAEVVFLDHIPEDLNVDVSQLYVFNKSKQEAKCNICHRIYNGKMASSHMREHLMVHTGERIWGCPYCQFCCNRRFALYMHVKKIHPDQPIKLVRRRPYQQNPSKSGSKRDSGINYTLNKEKGQDSQPSNSFAQPDRSKPKLKGPRCHREKAYLETSDLTWSCPYCSRKDVFKGAIVIHMKTVHADQDLDVEPGKDERPLELLRKLISENQLPMKEAKVKLFDNEMSEKYKVLQETLEENGQNLTHDLDLEDVERSAPKSQTMMRHAKYQCPYCPTRGVRPSTVKAHIIMNHPDKELYIHDLRVSRRTNNQHHLFVCRHQDCKFMTIMKKALYAHVAINPTHINTGLDADESIVDLEMPSRVPPLRIRKPEHYGVDDDVCMVDADDARPVTPAPATVEETPPEQPEPTQPESTLDDKPVPIIPTFLEEDIPEQEERNIPKRQPVKKRPQPAPKKEPKKPKRLKPPLPPNHRKGVELGSINMSCKYCDSVPSTVDMLMMKEHLISEHNSHVPIAIDVRQRDLRKSSRIHMCPMMECSYATYFSEAFLIHLNEEHSDVHFPFKAHIKHSNFFSPRVAPAKRDRAQVPTPDMSPCSVSNVLDSDVSDDWQISSKRRHKDSSDDEPEWTPGGRRKRRSARSRRVRKDVPSAPVSHEPLKMMHDIYGYTPPPPKDSRSSVPLKEPDNIQPKDHDTIDWVTETVPNYPSAQHLQMRFNCSICNSKCDSLVTIKEHLRENHKPVPTFCTDMHAKYMRKKQTVFLCMQLQCLFVCKTFNALKYHLNGEHGETVSAEYIQNLQDSVEMSPLLRKLGKKTIKTRTKIRINNQNPETDVPPEDPTVLNPMAELCDDSHIEAKLPDIDNGHKADLTNVVTEEQGDLGEDPDRDKEKPSDQQETLKKDRKRKGQPRKLTRAPAPEPNSEVLEPQKEEFGDDLKDPERQLEAKITDLVEEQLEPPSKPETDDDSDDSVHTKIDKSSEKNSDDSETEDSDTEEEGKENEDAAENSGSGDESDKVNSSSSPATSPKKQDSVPDRAPGKEDDFRSPKPESKASMDIMYQCSHCTYLSTSKVNIQAHLQREHDSREPEYTEIGAEFSHDGRVNMRVDEFAKDSDDETSENSANSTKNNSVVENSDADTDNRPERERSMSRIEPLKIAIRKTGEGETYVPQKRKKSTDSESETEKSPKRARDDSESSAESSEDGEESKDGSSSDTSGEEEDEEESAESSSGSESDTDSYSDSSESKDSSKS